MRTLATEEVAAKLAFELADGTRQRRLSDVAFLGSAGEIERSRHGQEVAHLVHFHQRCTPNPERRPGQSPVWFRALRMVIGWKVRIRAVVATRVLRLGRLGRRDDLTTMPII